MNNKLLSPQRLGALLRHDIVAQKKTILSGGGAIAGAVIVLTLLASAIEGDASTTGFHSTLFSNILFIGGYITTSLVFADLHKSSEGIRYLMIPGSTLEKLIARLVITSVGYTVFVGIVYTAASAIGAGLGQLIFSGSPGVFLHNNAEVWEAIGQYLVTQSAFLFGSIYFKKSAFLKTVLTFGAVGFGLGIVYLLTARVLFAPAFTGFLTITGTLEDYFPDPRGLQRIAEVIGSLEDVMVYVVGPLFFWIVSYLRLRETEV